MHALSLGTWWIHVTSVIEWSLAIILIQRRGLKWLALAMVPALISALAARPWHLFDNSEALRPLVTLQAALTLIGNVVLAWAAWALLQRRAAS